MALQTFTAGQVLTAAQVTALQTNDFNQTVSVKTDSYTLVAADKGTRVVMNKATATTITVNTSLFNAGDTLWIHNIGAGVCTITAGTATVSTAGSLALAQNAGGTLYFTSTGVAIFFPSASSSGTPMGTLINTTSFSAVATQSVNDVFSTTYDRYLIKTELTSASTNIDIFMRLRVSGSDASGSDYSYAGAGYRASGSGFNPVSTGTTYFDIGRSNTNFVCHATLDVVNPFKSVKTVVMGQFGAKDSVSTIVNNFAGNYDLTTSFTGFTIIASSGTITGSVNVYGYNK